MDIRCRKTICKFNKSLTCMADGITISPKILCTQYEKEPGKNPMDISKHIFDDVDPQICDYRHTKSLTLKCDAKCLFNNNHNCIANGITVNNIKNSPICITFAKP